jgi:hypothetical protein
MSADAPVLLKLGPPTIYSFGAMLALAFPRRARDGQRLGRRGADRDRVQVRRLGSSAG